MTSSLPETIKLRVTRLLLAAQDNHEVGHLASQLNSFLDLMEATLEDLRLQATQHRKSDLE